MNEPTTTREWRMITPEGNPTGPQSFEPAPVLYALDGSILQTRESPTAEWQTVDTAEAVKRMTATE